MGSGSDEPVKPQPVAPNQLDTREGTAACGNLPQDLIDDLVRVLAAHMPSIAVTQESSVPEHDLELERQLAEAKQQRDKLQSQNESMEKQISILHEERKQAELEKRSLLSKLKMAQMRDDDGNGKAVATAEIDGIIEEYKLKMTVTNALINDLRSDAAAKGKEIERLKEALASDNPQAAQIAAQDQRIAQLTKQLAEVKEDLGVAKEIEEKLAEFQKIKDKKDHEIASLKKQLADTRVREQRTADDLRSHLEQAMEQTAERQKEIDRMKSDFADVQSRHNKRDIEVANQLNDLKNQVNAASAQFDKQQRESQATQKKFEREQARTASLQAECDKLKRQLDEAHANMQKAESQLQLSRADLARLENSRRENEKRNSELESLLSEKSHQNAELQQQLALKAMRPFVSFTETDDTAIDPDLTQAVDYAMGSARPDGQEPSSMPSADLVSEPAGDAMPIPDEASVPDSGDAAVPDDGKLLQENVPIPKIVRAIDALDDDIDWIEPSPGDLPSSTEEQENVDDTALASVPESAPVREDHNREGSQQMSLFD